MLQRRYTFHHMPVPAEGQLAQHLFVVADEGLAVQDDGKEVDRKVFRKIPPPEGTVAVAQLLVVRKTLIVRMRQQLSPCCMAFVGVGIVKQDDPRADHLLKLDLAGELRPIDQNKVEGVNAMLRLYMLDRPGGHIGVPNIGDISLAPSQNLLQGVTVQCGRRAVVEGLHRGSIWEFVSPDREHIVAMDEGIVSIGTAQHLKARAGDLDAEKLWATRIHGEAGDEGLSTAASFRGPDLQHMTQRFGCGEVPDQPIKCIVFNLRRNNSLKLRFCRRNGIFHRVGLKACACAGWRINGGAELMDGLGS